MNKQMILMKLFNFQIFTCSTALHVAFTMPFTYQSEEVQLQVQPGIIYPGPMGVYLPHKIKWL